MGYGVILTAPWIDLLRLCRTMRVLQECATLYIRPIPKKSWSRLTALISPDTVTKRLGIVVPAPREPGQAHFRISR